MKSLIHCQLDLDVSLKSIVLGYEGEKMEKERENEKEMGIEEDKKVQLLS